MKTTIEEKILKILTMPGAYKLTATTLEEAYKFQIDNLLTLFFQEQVSLLERLEERYHQISGTYKNTERDWEAVINEELVALEKLKKRIIKLKL